MDTPHADEPLFEVPLRLEEAAETPRAKVDKTFRPYDRDQMYLLPPSIDDWVPEGHLCRFVSELVDEVLDLEPFLAAYTEQRGYPPYDPRLMVKLLVYGYITGVRSSRAIERSCTDSVPFRFLAANQTPDFRSIARFRQRHLQALRGLFLESLELCQQAGMVRLGRVALDGSKRRANASRRKAMSYNRMLRSETELKNEIEALLAQAEATDVKEDAAFGETGRDDELTGELARRTSRLAKIKRAKADLEEEARRRARDQAAEKARSAGKDEEAAARAGAKAEAEARPEDKAQRNFTDPDSRVMKTSDGSFLLLQRAEHRR